MKKRFTFQITMHTLDFLNQVRRLTLVEAREAQFFLVVYSLGCVAMCIIVFVTGRYWGLPLDYARQEHMPLIQLVVPPFFGILGSAATYVLNPPKQSRQIADARLMRALVYGPSATFVLLFVVITLVFRQSNDSTSHGFFSLDEYRTWLTVLLAMLACSTCAIANGLFRPREEASARARK